MSAVTKIGRGPRRTVSRGVRGAALIEALVAMLIFMVGVLGLVGLQGSMTRAQSESKLRADAAFLASDVVSRMWLDLTSIANYNGTGCATQLLCKEWQGKVATTLPGGTGSVAVDTTTGDVAVTVGWTLPDGQAHRYITRTTVAKAGG